jgi:hypothetical protein
VDPDDIAIELNDVIPSGMPTKLFEPEPRASTTPTASGAVITREALSDFYVKYDVQRLVHVGEELRIYDADQLLNILQTKYGYTPVVSRAGGTTADWGVDITQLHIQHRALQNEVKVCWEGQQSVGAMETILNKINALKLGIEQQKRKSGQFNSAESNEQLDLLLVSTKDLQTNIVRAVNQQLLQRQELGQTAVTEGDWEEELCRIPTMSPAHKVIQQNTITQRTEPNTGPSYEVFEVVFTSKPFGFKLGPPKDTEHCVVRESQNKIVPDGCLVLSVNGKDCTGLSVAQVKSLLKEERDQTAVEFCNQGLMTMDEWSQEHDDSVLGHAVSRMTSLQNWLLPGAACKAPAPLYKQTPAPGGGTSGHIGSPSVRSQTCSPFQDVTDDIDEDGQTPQRLFLGNGQTVAEGSGGETYSFIKSVRFEQRPIGIGLSFEDGHAVVTASSRPEVPVGSVLMRIDDQDVHELIPGTATPNNGGGTSVSLSSHGKLLSSNLSSPVAELIRSKRPPFNATFGYPDFEHASWGPEAGGPELSFASSPRMAGPGIHAFGPSVDEARGLLDGSPARPSPYPKTPGMRRRRMAPAKAVFHVYMQFGLDVVSCSSQMLTSTLRAKGMELSGRLAIYLSSDRSRLVCAAKTNQAEDDNNIFLSLRSEQEVELFGIQCIEADLKQPEAVRVVLSDGDVVVSAANPAIRIMIARHLAALIQPTLDFNSGRVRREDLGAYV